MTRATTRSSTDKRVTAFNGPRREPNWNFVPGAQPAPAAPGTNSPGLMIGPSGSLERTPPPKGQPIIYPWWQWEMPGSADWEINAINFTAAASATTDITGFSLEVGVGYVGVCTMLTLTVLNPVATLDLTFALLLNQGPVVGWNSIKPPPLAATAFVKDYNGMVVRMDEGQKFTARVVNGEASAYTCSLQARGWFTQKTTIDQLMSGIKY